MPRPGARAVSVGVARPEDPEPLRPGTYPVQGSGRSSSGVRLVGNEGQSMVSVSGAVQIDSLDDKNIAGSFAVVLSSFTGETETLSGSWSAPLCQFD